MTAGSVHSPSFRVDQQRTEDGIAVVGRSAYRLPFDPKGDALAYRSALRTALLECPSPQGCELEARYWSSDTARVDVENVLLYNVGAGAFSPHAVTALRLVRSHHSYDQDHPGLPHVSRYEFRTPGGVPRMRSVAATIDAVVPRRLSSDCSIALLWPWLRERVEIVDERSPSDALRISITSASVVRLVSTVKVVVDAVMASLSSQADAATGTLSELSRRSGRSLPETDALLAKGSLLGPRRLVTSRRDGGLQWNPDDDRLRSIYLCARQADLQGTLISAAIGEEA